MDLKLPRQNGVSLANDLRLHCRSVIIAVTSHQSEKYTQKGYEAGMKAIIYRPLTAEKFKDII